MPHSVAFELAVQDTYGLEVAARVRADRIELCSALPLGGVTPSLGLIAAAVAVPDIPPVHVLVRPRTGGFAYTPSEGDLIVADVEHALAAGAAGVVVGAVRDGEVDTGLIARVVACGAPVTFHRAFDMLPDPVEAIETLAGLGVRRILTAGGSATVAEALPAFAGLVEAAAGRIEIMAGGGVRLDLIPKLVDTGVDAVHASAKCSVTDSVGVVLGTAAGAGATTRETTDEAAAAAMRAALLG